MSTLTSRDAEATGNSGQALAVLDDHPATLPGSPTSTSSTPGTPADGTAMPASTIPASGATLRKPPDYRTRMRADRPDLHASTRPRDGHIVLALTSGMRQIRMLPTEQ
jgi:hypothetical protein